jgi:hypothetical protein
MLRLSSNVSDVFSKVLKLSSEVSECKPLPSGSSRTCVSGKGSRKGIAFGTIGASPGVSPAARSTSRRAASKSHPSTRV